MGPRPLYKPRTPSSLQITRAVPVRPLYTARVGPVYFLGRKEPCACRRVLITSSGHVTMPEATPAEAPHSALTGPSGRLATLTARLPRGELQLAGLCGAAMSRGAVLGDAGASSGTRVGDGGSGSCADMVWAARAWRLESVTVKSWRARAYRPSSPLRCLSVPALE
jgi:hypothetical protein